MTVLVTGVAGALGLHVAAALLRRGDHVLGVDDPARGDPDLRAARLAQLQAFPSFAFAALDPSDGAFLDRLAVQPRAVVHLAPAATDPARRVAAQLDLLGQCAARAPKLGHLVQLLPEHPGIGDRLADAEAVIGRAQARLHGLPQTALRLGEAYGLWGEPSGIVLRFADAILAGRPVSLPATPPSRHPIWLEDAAAGIVAALDQPPRDSPPFRRLGLEGPGPVESERLAGLLEAALGRVVGRSGDPRPRPGAPAFAPDVTRAVFGWKPRTGIEEGVLRFAAWYRERDQAAGRGGTGAS